MSRIDELIAELCPDGVEHKALGELGEFVRGNGLQKSDFTDEGVGCIHYGQVYTKYGTSTATTLSYVTPELAAKLRKARPGDLVVATTSENAEEVCKAVAWIGDEEVAISGDSCVFRHSLDPLYAAYFFQTEAFHSQKKRYITGAKVKRVSGGDLAKIRIPVPPRAVQRAIVDILSAMESLEAELKAELEARRGQYEHYRDRLLSFTDDEKSNTHTLAGLLGRHYAGGVETKELQELFHTRNGYTPAKSEAAFWEDGTVPWFRMEDIRENGHVLDDSLQRVSEAAVKGGGLFPADSILVATSATIGEHALITVPHLANQRFTSLAVKDEYKQRLDIKFAFYYCFLLDEWCQNNTTVSSFASVNMDAFKRFRFPLPPIELQRVIVDILDAFEALGEELAVEMNARRKQYEHYRSELLKFNTHTHTHS